MSRKVVFKDPTFGTLKAEHAKNMWRMLLAKAQKSNLNVDFKNIRMQGQIGHADWEAHYIFTKTGRHVVNKLLQNLPLKTD